jgi:hypothetical protein
MDAPSAENVPSTEQLKLAELDMSEAERAEADQHLDELARYIRERIPNCVL